MITYSNMRDQWAAMILCCGFAMIFICHIPASFAQTNLILSPDANEILFTDDMWEEEFEYMAAQEPVFISKSSDISVASPPANDSPETLFELMYLRDIAENQRTPENLAKIDIEQAGGIDRNYGVHASALPQHVKDSIINSHFLATRDAHYFIYKEKYRFKRPRPHQLDPELTLTIPLPRSAAYPSGHATTAWLGALVYSYIDPDNAALYYKHAGDVGFRRALAGIHYPSDSEAGRRLAEQIFDHLIAVPRFQQELENVKRQYQNAAAKMEQQN